MGVNHRGLSARTTRIILLGLLMILLAVNVCITQVSFTDSGQRLGDSNSNCVALGDIDSDGDLDAVVANGGYNADQDVEIWLNEGKGNFAPSDQAINHGKNLGVALADLNGDSYLDLFLCVAFGGPNRVFFNDGHGHFMDSGQRLGDANSGMVGLADLDEDGDTDAFIYVHPLWNGAESYHFGNEVWLNNGKGNFLDTKQKLGNGYNSGGAVGDVDGDGDIDAASASNFKNVGNQIFINDGKGSFRESSEFLSHLNSVYLAFGDLDGDHDLDAFVIYADTSRKFFNGIWFNNGKGEFTESSQQFGGTRSINVCLGDVDNDGDLDAFVAGGKYRVKEVSTVWLNDGKGVFTDSLVVGLDESKDVKLGDLDNDGDLDAFVVNNGPNKVWLNNASSLRK
jgi:hypothetical protein